MNPWLETLAVILVAILGVVLARAFWPMKRPFWLLGYLLPMLLIALLAIAKHSNSLSFSPQLFWMMSGRMRLVFLSLAISMGLTTPLPRLTYKFEKLSLCVVMVVMLSCFCILPFLGPALIQGRLADLTTTIDSDGICYQSENYTCGPAAAVTALRTLGLFADEGEIAVLSRTLPVMGTFPGSLYAALQDRYAQQGLKCQYRQFDSVEQLKDAGIILAVTRSALMLDHCVAVLDVSDKMVTIADPAFGKHTMSYEQFEKIWRFTGIVLKRDVEHSI